MPNSYSILQEMIELVLAKKRLINTTYFSGLKLDASTVEKQGIPTLLDWLFVQDFPGDVKTTRLFQSFSSKYIIMLVNESRELQKYFQIKDGSLAFSDSLSKEDALEMMNYVKQNYRPQVDIDFLE